MHPSALLKLYSTIPRCPLTRARYRGSSPLSAMVTFLVGLPELEPTPSTLYTTSMPSTTANGESDMGETGQQPGEEEFVRNVHASQMCTRAWGAQQAWQNQQPQPAQP